MGTAGQDVIEDSGRRPRRWPFLAVVIVIVVAACARWADAQLTQHESQLLAMRAANARATAEAARAKVLSTRQYTMPLLVSSSSATVRAGLERLIDDDAGDEKKQLQQARDAVARIDVLPWHHAMRATKNADLSLLDEQITALDAASRGADLKVLDVLRTTQR